MSQVSTDRFWRLTMSSSPRVCPQQASNLEKWLGIEDSNLGYLIQSQASYR